MLISVGRYNVFFGPNETANLKSGDMWPYNPLTREKFALKNKKMKGYAEELQQVGVVLGEKELKKVGRKRPGCFKSVHPLSVP